MKFKAKITPKEANRVNQAKPRARRLAKGMVGSRDIMGTRKSRALYSSTEAW